MLFWYSMTITIRNYLQPISKLWNHCWNTEIWDFLVYWSKNTSVVTIWVTLWITAFYEEKDKVFYITLKTLSFTILLPSWWINHIVLNGNLANNFQISGQKYAKTENDKGDLGPMRKWRRCWCEVLLTAVAAVTIEHGRAITTQCSLSWKLIIYLSRKVFPIQVPPM